MGILGSIINNCKCFNNGFNNICINIPKQIYLTYVCPKSFINIIIFVIYSHIVQIFSNRK